MRTVWRQRTGRNDLIFELVDNPDALKNLEPEWLDFFDRVPGSTPFQHPRWLLTWWSHFGSGRLHVLVFRDQNRIAGLLPCFLHDWNGRRQNTLVGAGISDYLDPLVDSRCREQFSGALQAYFEDWAEWDVCDWQDLSADTPIRNLQTCGSFSVAVSHDSPCSEIQLTGSFDQLWESRSKDMRRNLRRYSERARGMGPVEFEVSREADGEWLNELVRLHAARWERQGESGMIAANASEDFLRTAAKEFAALGSLRFFGVRFKSRLAALVLTFLHRNQVFSYMSAFDPEYEILGFGRMLLYEAIRYSYQQGYSTWNFLRGDEPYKFSWGARRIDKCRVTLQQRHDE